MSNQPERDTAREFVTSRMVTGLRGRYGLEVKDVKQLVGYNDLNMKLTACGKLEEYLLKLSPYADEKQFEHIELQHKIMDHLRDHGIPVAVIINTVQGGDMTTVNLASTYNQSNGGQYIERLLSFLPGETLLEAGNPGYLMEDVGRLTGRVDTALKNFCGKPVEIESLWMLSKAPALEPLLEKYCSPDVVQLGKLILQAYTVQIAPYLNLMQKGYIHGDINNCNIIVQRLKGDDSSSPESAFTITGLIDFEDVCYSFYVYEIAIIMGDLMSSCLGKDDPLAVARSVLNGYRREFELLEIEISCLKLTICIRMLQLYVLRYYSETGSDENDYRSLECEENLQVCKLLWAMDDQGFMDKVVQR